MGKSVSRRFVDEIIVLIRQTYFNVNSKITPEYKIRLIVRFVPLDGPRRLKVVIFRTCFSEISRILTSWTRLRHRSNFQLIGINLRE